MSWEVTSVSFQPCCFSPLYYLLPLCLLSSLPFHLLLLCFLLALSMHTYFCPCCTLLTASLSSARPPPSLPVLLSVPADDRAKTDAECSVMDWQTYTHLVFSLYGPLSPLFWSFSTSELYFQLSGMHLIDGDFHGLVKSTTFFRMEHYLMIKVKTALEIALNRKRNSFTKWCTDAPSNSIL